VSCSAAAVWDEAYFRTFVAVMQHRSFTCAASMQDMHRALALRIKDDFQRNGRIVRRLRETCQVALVLLLCEIMAWMFSIAA
jgi:hypothetical protein